MKQSFTTFLKADTVKLLETAHGNLEEIRSVRSRTGCDHHAHVLHLVYEGKAAVAQLLRSSLAIAYMTNFLELRTEYQHIEQQFFLN